mmetsp:Transcript_35181/g.92056  ORF Transcript_35181/g.92056 Transcript_35181/m.92056 type:complete len:501 (+) Transcript_35181:205-1707(+)
MSAWFRSTFKRMSQSTSSHTYSKLTTWPSADQSPSKTGSHGLKTNSPWTPHAGQHKFASAILSRKASVNHVTLVIFLEFFAWGLVATILPEYISEFFGPGQMWVVVGVMQGLKGFFSFLTAPMVGALSDVMGRRVFLLVTVGATCLPLAFLLVSNLWWHVVASILSGPFAVTFSIVFAYVSDVTDEETRSAAFGQVSATFAGSMVISPAVGSFIYTVYGRDAVFATSCAVAALDIVYILAVVPESLPADIMARRVFDWKTVNPFNAMKLLTTTPLMSQLSTVIFFSYLPEAGEYQILMLYLENTLSMSKAELSLFIAILGILSIVAQTFVLGLLADRWTDKSVITFGLFGSITQLTVFGLLTIHWVLFGNTMFVAIGSMVYPAVSAYVANNASPDEQGAVQGLITGVRSLCNGLGPALFGVLFQWANSVSVEERRSGPDLAALPGFPFLVGAMLVVVALVVNMRIDPNQPMDDRRTGLAESVTEKGEQRGRASLEPPESD